MRKRWKVKEFTEKAKSLAKELDLDPIIVQILLNREIKEEDFRFFLNPSPSSFFCPHLLPDIEIAIDRIKKAVRKGEKVSLFGDYDVDGITSLAIFYDYIKNQPVETSFYIPHRLKEGFGLNKDAIKRIKRQGTNLLICFDCGTNSLEEIELAKALGIDTIVVDHHQPKEGYNFPFAFINPKRKDSRYPFNNLSSAALTFKLVQALKQSSCLNLLDLVALSIVCDVVPLKGENRALLKEGLKWLKRTNRLALNVLCQTSGVKIENIDTFHLGYILGPRINASGRVDSAKYALEIFLTQDIVQARKLAYKLEEYNRLRRDIENVVLREAEETLARDYGDFSAIVVHKEGWHHGILGIVASRLVDKYYRPTFVIGFEQQRGRGSARSIANFNLMEALGHCEQYLANYGGHKKAAGIEIFYKDVDGFKQRIGEVAKKLLSPQDLIPVLDIDLEIEFKDISLELAIALEKLKPFGEGNPLSLFLTRKVSVKQAPKLINSGMYSIWLTDSKYTYEAIFFERNEFLDLVNYGKDLDIVYALEENRFHNSVKLVLKDVRLH